MLSNFKSRSSGSVVDSLGLSDFGIGKFRETQA